jgi:hypothetical protein
MFGQAGGAAASQFDKSAPAAPVVTSTSNHNAAVPSAAARSAGPSNVAFGVARGGCSSEVKKRRTSSWLSLLKVLLNVFVKGCDCGLYRWDGGHGGEPSGGPCQNCGHFPAAHARQVQRDTRAKGRKRQPSVCVL